MVVFLRRNEIDAARVLTRKPEKRQVVASSSSLSSTSSVSAHIFSKSLVSQSPPENIKPPEKPMNNFSIKARSFNPEAEELSGMGVIRYVQSATPQESPTKYLSEKENNPINTDNIFQLNMMQQHVLKGSNIKSSFIDTQLEMHLRILLAKSKR